MFKPSQLRYNVPFRGIVRNFIFAIYCPAWSLNRGNEFHMGYSENLIPRCGMKSTQPVYVKYERIRHEERMEEFNSTDDLNLED
jgi:hypothetical protein